ncbi:hypothetical protein OJF2_60910 [Aquisphaera giovannonii]|uniref:Uncharacterized protein n=1 Tax=Aquisphaera giovannonii TaxID=406548 RepID=A0A5B9WC87_9BACT|nr:hypothetical protein [Aquisphaera giovannonii]QEH37500.1 hypothetical protein OJF2_60910 [Aquisphaera giovannonii]
MISDARLAANRRNARKSTGPRTPEGKAESRLNGMKHGGRSAILGMPVLPREDPKALARLIDRFVREGRPGDSLERSLLERAARLTWAIERSDRAEAAYLADAARRASAPPAGREGAAEERSRRVTRLAAELFHPLSPHEFRDADWRDDPAAALAGLEETAEGRRWLLEQWRSIRAYFVAGLEPAIGDFYRYIRLHGRHVTDLAWDLDLNAAMAAAEVAWPGCGRLIYGRFLAELHAEDWRLFEQQRQWRTFAPLPATPEEAVAVLLRDAESQMARLAAMLCEGDGEEVDPDAAAFEAELELAGHRRAAAARTRELMQVLEQLRKLRKDRGAAATTVPLAEPDEPSPSDEAVGAASVRRPGEPSPADALAEGGGFDQPSPALTIPDGGGCDEPGPTRPPHGGGSHGEPEPEPAPTAEADRWEPAPIVIAEDDPEPPPPLDDEDEQAPPPGDPPAPGTWEAFERWFLEAKAARVPDDRTQGETLADREKRKFAEMLSIALDTPTGRAPDYDKYERRRAKQRQKAEEERDRKGREAQPPPLQDGS